MISFFVLLQVDKGVIEDIAKDEIQSDWDNATLVKTYGCNDETEKIYFVKQTLIETNLTAVPTAELCNTTLTFPLTTPMPLHENSTMTPGMVATTPMYELKNGTHAAMNITTLCMDGTPLSQLGETDYRVVSEMCYDQNNMTSVCHKVYEVVHTLDYDVVDKKCK